MAEAVLTRRSVVKNEYELLADITVSSATTQVDITGLNIGKDEEIVLVSDYVCVDGNAYIGFNNNTTLTNYYVQTINANGTSPSSIRYNLPILLGAITNAKSFGISKIKLTNSGYCVWQTNSIREYEYTSMFLFDVYGTSVFTVTPITSIRIFSSSANGIGIGSRFQLYKVGGA